MRRTRGARRAGGVDAVTPRGGSACHELVQAGVRAAIQVPQPGLELEALVERAQRHLVVVTRGQLVERERQLEVGCHRHQPAPQRQKIQMLAQVLAHLAAHLVGVGDQFIQAAILRQPFHRGLGAALLHPRHVVHGVTDEGEVIDDALGEHAKLGLHPRHIEHFLAHRVHPAHAGAHELDQVLVAGGNHHLPAALHRLPRQGADDVVGLDPLHRQQRPALGLHRRVQGLDLGAQIVGHGGAVGLVVGIPVVAKGLALGVEHAGAEFRLVVAFQPT